MEQNVIIGRILDATGKPIVGTGIKISTNSKTYSLLKVQAKTPVLFANPVTKEIGAVVTVDNENKGLCILPPGGSGPPMHVHPNYDENFEVLDGEFVFYCGNETLLLKAGQKTIIKRGEKHTFKPSGNSYSSFVVEAKPPGNLNEIVHTVFGLGIEGQLNSKGMPGFWQGIMIGKESQDDTLFVTPTPAIQKLMFKLFGSIAYKKGYRGIYEKYLSDEFWYKHVEQL